MSDFVICINNDSNPASLIVGKGYRTVPDVAAESHNMVRVIDEDKFEPDGYLYPTFMFAFESNCPRSLKACFDGDQ